MSTTNVILEAPITFVVPGGAVHCPLVHVRVHGVETSLFLDTGASDHILTLALVAAADLPSEPGEAGSDLAGASIPSWSLGDVPLQVGAHGLTLRNAIAIEGPPMFAGWGIGGFVSPQSLHASATVVLDLIGDTLHLIESDDACGWLGERYPGAPAIAIERVEGEVLLTRASIEPFDQVVTQLDSGSNATEFGRAAVPGLIGAASAVTGRGVSGIELHGSEVRDQTLRVGEMTFVLPAMSIRDDSDRPPGLIGMDVLRGTALAISPDPEAPIWMLVPPSHATVAPR